MADQRTLLVCSCEDTMPVDGGASARGCTGVKIVSGRQLCRAELDWFRAPAASDAPGREDAILWATLGPAGMGDHRLLPCCSTPSF
jgi:hypothetical protein